MKTKNAVAVKSGSTGALAPSSAVGSGQSTPAAGTGPQAPAGKVVGGFRVKLQQMLAGVNAMLPAGATVTSVGNTALSKSEMAAQLTGALGTYAAVDSEEHSLALARQELKSELPSMRAFYTEFKAALVQFYGKGSPSLAQYGIQSKGARKALTPVQQVQKTARAKQTREIRHTLGKVQKASRKFVGTVDLSTAVNGPAAAPSSDAAPAAPTPPVTPGK